MFPKVNCQHLEENASGDCTSLSFLRTSRTRLSRMAGVQLILVWSQEVHQVTITSQILYVYRPYCKSKQHKWEFSLQLHGCHASRTKVLSNTFGLSLP